MMKNTARRAIQFGVIIVATSAVGAESKKPIAEWACTDFLAVDDQFRPKVVYAATAYVNGGKPEVSVIDIVGTEKVIPMVIDDCKRTPQSSFWQTLKDDWTKVKADAKAELKKL